MQLVFPIWQTGYRDVSIPVGDAEVWGIHCNDDGAHLRVNITKQKTHPDAVKSNRVGRPRFIKTQIETLAIKQGEDIVKEWIAIGELHHRTHWYDQQMRLKALVLLNQLQSLVRLFSRRGVYGGAIHGLQPNDHVRRISWRCDILPGLGALFFLQHDVRAYSIELSTCDAAI